MTRLIVRQRPTCASCGAFTDANPYVYITVEVGKPIPAYQCGYCPTCSAAREVMQRLADEQENDDA